MPVDAMYSPWGSNARALTGPAWVNIFTTEVGIFGVHIVTVPAAA